jgi:CDP-glucose 4,6-dehydratase
MVNPGYWHSKKVLITGHTGFKGSWLAQWLIEMGAEVHGYALAPTDPNALFSCLDLEQAMNSQLADITDLDSLNRAISTTQPDVIFHMAAQALVRASYDDPLGTFQTNVTGTANLLNCAREINHACTVIVVTSDKCYLNNERRQAYKETDPLGGADPYSASKACAELVTESFRHSFFSDNTTNIRLASARAGNVIGGGDWSADRLIPDFIRAGLADEPIEIRFPQAIRPWQHVLEPLSGYLILAEKLSNEPSACRAWNFGPAEHDVLSVADLLKLANQHWPIKQTHHNRDNQPHEAGILMLDSSAARSDLGWKPQWNVAQGVEETMNWYNAWRNDDDMQQFTLSQINQYCALNE